MERRRAKESTRHNKTRGKATSVLPINTVYLCVTFLLRTSPTSVANRGKGRADTSHDPTHASNLPNPHCRASFTYFEELHHGAVMCSICVSPSDPRESSCTLSLSRSSTCCCLSRPALSLSCLSLSCRSCLSTLSSSLSLSLDDGRIIFSCRKGELFSFFFLLLDEEEREVAAALWPKQVSHTQLVS